MKVVSVTELNEYIKRKFDNDFILKNICITGEISNYVAHSSGHAYFSLKDNTGILKAVMFKGFRKFLEFTPKNGMSVTAVGDVNVFVRDGVYQLYVTRMSKAGIGVLFQEFEKRKNNLADAGLFDESLKRPLPQFPERIGVITSDTGAVWHDIQNVVSRRFPLTELLLYPARVQGERAAETMIAALRKLNQDAKCDIAILARGGGSLEDLWEFNDEKLAYAIRESAVPVVSAVGHETDFTIADFAADLRAPTPSAAAELCVPDCSDVRLLLDRYAVNFQTSLFDRIDLYRNRLEFLQSRIAKKPLQRIAEQRLKSEKIRLILNQSIQRKLTAEKLALAEVAGKLNNPLSILQKGYGIVNHDTKQIRNIHDVKFGDKISIRMRDGLIHAEVINTEDIHEI